MKKFMCHALVTGLALGAATGRPAPAAGQTGPAVRVEPAG